MDFPELLQNHLDRRGWTRTTLLAALEQAGHRRTRATISNWMGTVRPDPQVLPTLVDVLGLDGPGAVELYHAAGYPLPAVLQQTPLHGRQTLSRAA